MDWKKAKEETKAEVRNMIYELYFGFGERIYLTNGRIDYIIDRVMNRLERRVKHDY